MGNADGIKKLRLMLKAMKKEGERNQLPYVLLWGASGKSVKKEKHEASSDQQVKYNSWGNRWVLEHMGLCKSVAKQTFGAMYRKKEH